MRLPQSVIYAYTRLRFCWAYILCLDTTSTEGEDEEDGEEEDFDEEDDDDDDEEEAGEDDDDSGGEDEVTYSLYSLYSLYFFRDISVWCWLRFVSLCSLHQI